VKPIRVLAVTALSGVLACGVAACGDDSSDAATASSASNLSGNIKIDGSSTVFPFAQAAAERFKGENSGVDISVGESGTGGGFEKFCAGETDISDASRPIKPDEEAPVCEKAGIGYSEVQVANDGIAIVTNKDLAIDCMTTDQLKALWNKDSKISNYKDLDPKFPDQKVALFGPGTDSGTFDFFTGEINGDEGDTRKDYSPSEDDNVTVQGVSGDKGGLLRLLLLRGQRRQPEPRQSRRGCRLRRAERGDDPGRHLQAARAPVVHVPVVQGDRPPRGQGLHGLHPRQPASDRRRIEDRRADRGAGREGEGRPRQGRELSSSA
jgi:phosphate binding protein